MKLYCCICKKEFVKLSKYHIVCSDKCAKEFVKTEAA